MEQHKIYPALVEWRDATNVSIGWHDGVEDHLDTRIQTIGFVIGEDEMNVVISHSLGDTGLSFDAFIIPKGCIINIYKIPVSEGGDGEDKAQI